jgi:chloramphenicol-sensitive protein RarD
MPSPRPTLSPAAGVAYAVAAYAWWGVVTVWFFKQITAIPPIDIVSHRLVWTLLFVLILLATFVPSGLASYWRMLTTPKLLLPLTLAALLVAGNWLIFICAVQWKMVLAGSMGYFATPLVQMVLSVLVLREPMRPWQTVSVVLGAVALALVAIRVDVLTASIACGLALTFGFYALVRKKLAVDAIPALGVECTALLPLGLAWIVWSLVRPQSQLAHADGYTWAMLALAGVITAVPLIFFGAAAKRITLRTIAFCQYIGPTLQMFMALAIYREPITEERRWLLVSFAIIWVALVIYMWDFVRAGREKRGFEVTPVTED